MLLLVGAGALVFPVKPGLTLGNWGVDQWILPTEYSDWFSHQAFFSVQPDMTCDEVVALLGEPFHVADTMSWTIHTLPDGKKKKSGTPVYILYFSRSPTGSSDRIHSVTIEKATGTVRHRWTYTHRN